MKNYSFCRHGALPCMVLRINSEYFIYIYFADRASQYISSLNLCTGRPPIGVMIPETV